MSSKSRIFPVVISVFLPIFLVPFFTFATGPLVPCGTVDLKTIIKNTDGTVSTKDGADGVVDNPCGFDDTIKIVQNIINFLIIIGVSAAALGFAYAGFLYITAMGSAEKIRHAHAIFIKVIWGFAFMLSAWLIVYTLENTFLSAAQKKASLLKCPGTMTRDATTGECR
jgi:hypothetical protein